MVPSSFQFTTAILLTHMDSNVIVIQKDHRLPNLPIDNGVKHFIHRLQNGLHIPIHSRWDLDFRIVGVGNDLGQQEGMDEYLLVQPSSSEQVEDLGPPSFSS